MARRRRRHVAEDLEQALLRRGLALGLGRAGGGLGLREEPRALAVHPEGAAAVPQAEVLRGREEGQLAAARVAQEDRAEPRARVQTLRSKRVPC